MYYKNITFKSIIVVCIILFFTACTTNKYASTNKVYRQMAKDFAKTIKASPPKNQSIDSLPENLQAWVGTVNMGIRKPNFVVIHHTAQDSTAQTLKTFTLTLTKVSAHYVVGRDGKVYQMVNDYLRAQHAGAGRWGNDTDLNSSSIGIEMDNNGTTDLWTDAQINSLCTLLATLKKRHNIPTANFIGHADLAPGRKNDPKNFPWGVLAKKGFGFWYDEILQMPPENFDTTSALRIIGYNVKNLTSAIEAFKIHFVQTDITPVLTETDKLILYNLYQKYL